MRRAVGFTLMELMITIVLIGILASMALPMYSRTVERQRHATARDALMSIYAGEQLYASLNNGDYFSLNGNDSMTTWRDNLHMDNPQPADGSVSYKVQANNGKNPQTFTATATRIGGTNNNKTLTIDENRAYGGNWSP